MCIRDRVKRIGDSDVLEVSYTTDDPGIVYQTLLILIDEFNKQYQDLDVYKRQPSHHGERGIYVRHE